MNGDSVVAELARTVAEVEGVEAHELDYSLYEYVDTEAICSLAAFDRPTWTLTFQLPRHEISLEGTGEIRIDGDVHRRLDSAQFETTD